MSGDAVSQYDGLHPIGKRGTFQRYLHESPIAPLGDATRTAMAEVCAIRLTGPSLPSGCGGVPRMVSCFSVTLPDQAQSEISCPGGRRTYSARWITLGVSASLSLCLPASIKVADRMDG